MLAAFSNIYYLVIGFPGAIWRTLKYVFGEGFGRWWDSHY